MKANATENEIQKFKLHYGDVIITKNSETPEEIAIPALVKHEAEDLICGYHLTRIKADTQKLLGEYLFRMFQTKMFNANFEAAATGVTRLALSSDVFKDVQVLLPPLPEQTAIAQYLDTKTAQLDKLIANKQKLITLLREERTAFINQAVSGEGKNWKKKLKYVARLRSGESITADDIRPEGEFPVYGGNGLRGYTTTYTHAGDYVLIGRQGALCGNINYANGKFFASEHAVVVSILDGSEFLWLGELLRSMNLNQYSLASAQAGLSVERIQNLSITVPSLPERFPYTNRNPAHRCPHSQNRKRNRTDAGV